MLQQRAERSKLSVTSVACGWTAIDLLCVRRTLEMLIQRGEGLECPVTQDALVGTPVERALGRPVSLSFWPSVVGPVRPFDEFLCIGDNVVFVSLNSVAVDYVARGT